MNSWWFDALIMAKGIHLCAPQNRARGVGACVLAHPFGILPKWLVKALVSIFLNFIECLYRPLDMRRRRSFINDKRQIFLRLPGSFGRLNQYATRILPEAGIEQSLDIVLREIFPGAYIISSGSHLAVQLKIIQWQLAGMEFFTGFPP